ncbi:MAG: hypothetical protein MZV64_58690 [Ignavibacteriales bacterium]|nr:hypothetical protein [Ignavibacteriales bacterium]
MAEVKHLFGVKANFKMGPFISNNYCKSEERRSERGMQYQAEQLLKHLKKEAYDYSTNHYFVDTIYASQNPNLEFI